MPKSYSLGEKFHKLTITGHNIKTVGTKNRKINTVFCVCDCGGETETTITRLRSGHTSSCGCISEARKYKHGMARTSEYKIWTGMRGRCENLNNTRWEDYGGRGIKVDKRWLSFPNFIADMGRRPKGTSLDRIDNNKGYSKENCRWATATEQQNNMRTNVSIEYGGESKTLAEWSRKINIKNCTLRTRIKRGWSIQRAFATPKGKYHGTYIDKV